MHSLNSVAYKFTHLSFRFGGKARNAKPQNLSTFKIAKREMRKVRSLDKEAEKVEPMKK